MGNKKLHPCISSKEPFLLTLLGLASHYRYTKLEGNQSSTERDIKPPHSRRKVSICECIRSPAATVTQNYIVCRPTHFAISVKTGKRHSLRGLIKTGPVCTPLLKKEKAKTKNHEIAKP